LFSLLQGAIFGAILLVSRPGLLLSDAQGVTDAVYSYGRSSAKGKKVAQYASHGVVQYCIRFTDFQAFELQRIPIEMIPLREQISYWTGRNCPSLFHWKSLSH